LTCYFSFCTNLLLVKLSDELLVKILYRHNYERCKDALGNKLHKQSPDDAATAVHIVAYIRVMLFINVGNRVHIRHLSINGLLPTTDDYVTYDGSLTQPGCQETVTWIIINKPIYISNEHVR